MAGKRSKSSERWLRRQERDYFARRAKSQGQISRAHYKLSELDQKYGLIRGHYCVLELGAAPGGWTTYIEERLSRGTLIAVDPLPITAGANTRIIEGCAGEAHTDAAIGEAVAQHSTSGEVDLVLSDMAPNMSGVRAVDQARSMELADVALNARKLGCDVAVIWCLRCFRAKVWMLGLPSVGMNFVRYR